MPLLADTWEWDGTNWTQRSPGVSPPPLCSHAMAYDQRRAVTVLFGGMPQADDLESISNDTWEWDGAAWSQRSSSTSPPARAIHAMAYDSSRDVSVVFGGYSANIGDQDFGDTWEWNGTNWSQVNSKANPSGRIAPALAYDVARGVVVLFGGETIGDDCVNMMDTWELDGTAWALRTPNSAPHWRSEHAMAYDSLRHSVVAFGGLQVDGPLNDTWEWKTVQ
jgi:hypothetical protein